MIPTCNLILINSFLLTEHCWNGQNLQSMKKKIEIKNVMSAWSCGDECRKRSSCTSWTWRHKGAGTTWAYICNLAEGYGSKNQDPSVLSGDRECLKHSKCLNYCNNLRDCLQPPLLLWEGVKQKLLNL